MGASSIYLVVFKVDNDSDTLVDVTDTVENVEMSGTRANGRYNGLGSSDTKVSEGPRSTTITGTALGTDGATDAYSIFEGWWESGGARTFEAYDPDETTGSLKWTGEAKLTSWARISKNSTSGDIPKHAFTIEVDGAVIKSTVA